LLGLSSLNLPLSGGTLNGTLNGTVEHFHCFEVMVEVVVRLA
jgi:hypothetical protein